MHAHAKTAVKSLSAAALVGGMTFGVGLTSPASAMRLDAGGSPTPSIGAQCQAARAALSTASTTTSTSGTTTTGEDTSPAPSLVPGEPGLRCGQVFSKAHKHAQDSTDESTSAVPSAPVPTTSTDQPTSGEDQSTKSEDDATESQDIQSDDDGTDAEDQSDDDGASQTQSFSGWTGSHHHSEHHGEHHDD